MKISSYHELMKPKPKKKRKKSSSKKSHDEKFIKKLLCFFLVEIRKLPLRTTARLLGLVNQTVKQYANEIKSQIEAGDLDLSDFLNPDKNQVKSFVASKFKFNNPANKLNMTDKMRLPTQVSKISKKTTS